MTLVERVKGILGKPKEEWEKISLEDNQQSAILTGYLIPLALIPAIASFIGYSFIGVLGVHSLTLGLKHAVISLVSTIIGAYITAFIVDLLAPGFSAQKNFNRAFALVVYAATPQYVAGVLYIFPFLGIIVLLAAIYGLYLLYIGMKPMMKVSDDKHTIYFIISLIVVIAVYFVVSAILSAIFIGSMAMRGAL